MASSKPDEKPAAKPKPVKKDWSGYSITPSFRLWAAPIVDNSYGTLTNERVLKILIDHDLVDEVLPRIEDGIQPLSDHGPVERYRTPDHKYESNTKEFLEIKNLCYGRPKKYRPVEPGPPTETESYAVGKMHDT